MKVVPLGEVATIERRGVDPASLEPATLYLGLEHIERGGRIIGHSTISDAELASTKFTFTSDHVLFGKLRPNLGKVCRPEFAGICSTDILPIKPSSNLDRNYLAHFLSQPSMVEFAASHATGANLPRLSPTQLAKFEVPLPPLDEQRRIAAILDQADSLRTGRLQATALLHSLAWSMFRDTFGEFSDPTPRWPIVEFGDLISEGPQNGLYKPAKDYGAGTLIARIDSYQDGLPIDPARLKRVRISESEAKLYALITGDIVINRVNARTHLGKATMVTGLIETTVFESNMMRIRLDTRRAQSEYIIAAFGTQYIKGQIQAAAKDAVNQSSINQKDVMGFKIPLPPLDQQSRYIRCRERLQQVHLLQKRSMTDLDELFASLQSRAFRGEL